MVLSKLGLKPFILAVLGLAIFAAQAFAQGDSGFVRPWLDETRALVLDPYAGNKSFDCEKTTADARVAAIIHKGTEGYFMDKSYSQRKVKCKNGLGFKWGSYHLGRAGNPEKQAEFYINSVKPEADELIALDMEDDGGKFMSVAEAARFVKRVHELTGRYPMLYITGKVHGIITRGFASRPELQIFKNTPLWYARYCDDISCYFPPKQALPVLERPSLWQFASEINCNSRKTRSRSSCTVGGKCSLNTCPLTQPIAGADFSMDVNIYNGTVEELRSRWPNI